VPAGRKISLFHCEGGCPSWVVVFDVRKRTARLLVFLTGETLSFSCQTGKPGLGPTADLLLLLSPREVGKRRRPDDGGPRCARTAIIGDLLQRQLQLSLRGQRRWSLRENA
jgi:hypothetical protein